MRTVPFLPVLLALSGCSDPGDSMRTEVPTSKIELGQLNRGCAAALNAKDAKAAAALYTEDAVLIPPGESIVQGRDAIEEYWSAAIELGGVRDVSVETVDAQSSGSLGFETGRFELTVNGPDGEAVIDRGEDILNCLVESLMAGGSPHTGSGTHLLSKHSEPCTDRTM